MSMEGFKRECLEFFDKLSVERRLPLVFGDGNENSPVLMLIGEAPGERETLMGKPFVGKAGKNLSEFLSVLGLQRSDIYISNVVKVRPTRAGKRGGECNRPPTREEIELFTPWLMREIAIIKPQALVTLGNVALGAFANRRDTIGMLHGRWRQAVVTPPEGAAITLPHFPLYHPASVIYNRSLADAYMRDLSALRGSLAL